VHHSRQGGLHRDSGLRRCARPADATVAGTSPEAEAACLPHANSTHVRMQSLLVSSMSHINHLEQQLTVLCRVQACGWPRCTEGNTSIAVLASAQEAACCQTTPASAAGSCPQPTQVRGQPGGHDLRCAVLGNTCFGHY